MIKTKTMITNFESITNELSTEEKKMIPILIKGFSTRTSQNPIKAPDIIRAINSKDYGLKNKFTEVRLRKICNFIRTNGIIPLCATSKGYYVSYDKNEIQNQILSLRERAEAILACADGMTKFMK